MEPPYQRHGATMIYLKASHAGIEPIHPSQLPQHARVMTAACFCYSIRHADAAMLAGNPDKIERLATMVFPE